MNRDEAIQFLDNMKHAEAGRAIGKEGFYAELLGYHIQALNMAIKALEQQTCEDAISRAEAIKAMNDIEQEDIELYGCHIPEGFDGKRAIEALQSLPSVALSAEPCKDAISRQAVLDINESHHGQMPNHINHQIWQEIKELPSVNPQQKTGHWIVHPKGIYAHLICDNCLSNAPYDCRTNYCPDCGAKMVEPQEKSGEE